MQTINTEGQHAVDPRQRPNRAPSSPAPVSAGATGRRVLALSAGAIAAVGLIAGTAASVPGGVANFAAPHPDGDLIEVCRDHVANLHAFNAHGDLDNPDCPFWAAYYETKDAVSEAEPGSLAGIVAKAWAAKAEAMLPDGSEDPAGGPAEDWAWDLVNDLLRIVGGEA